MPSPTGHDIMAPVATSTAVIPASRLHGHHDRPSMVSVGTIVWLSSELMFFAALFASYFTIRAVSPDLWALNTEKLNVPFAVADATALTTSLTSRSKSALSWSSIRFCSSRAFLRPTAIAFR